MEKITLRRLFDAHCHCRIGEMLFNVLRHTARYCAYATVMPNLEKAILSGKDVRRYREEIDLALNNYKEKYDFTPQMTIAIRDNTTPEMVYEAKKAGAIAGKIYPLGVTTNSDKGLRNFFSENITKTFRTMEEKGVLLLIHGEIDRDRTLVTKREEVCLPIVYKLSLKFPNLKIVLEHITTKNAVELILKLHKNVAATITAHHLYLTLNDVIGYGIQPHHGCMPIPKDFDDRDALIWAATSGNKKFFLGSDSAPHLRENKECAIGACGVFTAPVLPQILAEVFEKQNALDRLGDFTSTYGSQFYGLPKNTGTITLIKKPWIVPDEYNGIVPFKAGGTLAWKLQN